MPEELYLYGQAKPCGTTDRGGVIVRAEFLRAGTIQELKSKGRLVVRGAHRPILVVVRGETRLAVDRSAGQATPGRLAAPVYQTVYR